MTEYGSALSVGRGSEYEHNRNLINSGRVDEGNERQNALLINSSRNLQEVTEDLKRIGATALIVSSERHQLEDADIPHAAQTLNMGIRVLKELSSNDTSIADASMSDDDKIKARKALNTLTAIKSELDTSNQAYQRSEVHAQNRKYVSRIADVEKPGMDYDDAVTQHRTERYEFTKALRKQSEENAKRDVPGYKKRIEARAKKFNEALVEQREQAAQSTGEITL